MYPEIQQHRFFKKMNFLSPFNIKKQQGISLALLLFVLIIVSLLAIGIIRLNSQSLTSISHQVISTRAFFAAESGANLQALSIFPLTGSGSCNNQIYSFSVDGLAGCTATTICRQISIDSNNFYQVTSEGQCNSGQILQATRTIEIRLKEIVN